MNITLFSRFRGWEKRYKRYHSLLIYLKKVKRDHTVLLHRHPLWVSDTCTEWNKWDVLDSLSIKRLSTDRQHDGHSHECCLTVCTRDEYFNAVHHMSCILYLISDMILNRLMYSLKMPKTWRKWARAASRVSLWWRADVHLVWTQFMELKSVYMQEYGFFFQLSHKWAQLDLYKIIADSEYMLGKTWPFPT